VLYLWLIILLVRGDVSVNSKTLLMTDFMNLKIKVGSVFQMCSYVHEYLRLYCIFFKKSPHGLSFYFVYQDRMQEIVFTHSTKLTLHAGPATIVASERLHV
jgi:hypothetical protein